MTHIIVYKTINKITGAFYIGVHKTDNLNDSYLGSGVKLNDNIKKYGKHNYYRTTLFEFDDVKLAYKKEQEILKECLCDKKCLNLSSGGIGGYGWTAEKKVLVKFKDNPKKCFRVSIDDKRYLSGELIPSCYGYKTSDEAKKKMSLSHMGHICSEAERDKHRLLRHTHETKLLISQKTRGNMSKTGYKWYHSLTTTKEYNLLPNDKKIKNENLFPGRNPQIAKLLRERTLGRHMTIEDKTKISKSMKCRKWYNDGTNTYFLNPTDEKIITDNLKCGRKLK